MKVLSTVWYLARQGLPLRNDEIGSNFYQLMPLRREDFNRISEFLDKKQLKYTSHEIQNEILSLMSHYILRDKVKEIQSAFF